MHRQFKRTSHKKRSSRNQRNRRGSGRTKTYRNRTQRGGADVEVIIDVLNKQWTADTPEANKNKLRIIRCIESISKGEIPPFPVSPAEIKTQLEANPAIKGLLSNQGFKDSIKTLEPASGGDFFKWLGLDSASTEDIPVETLKNAIKKITSLADDTTRVIIEDALSLTLSDKTRDTINKIVADTPLPFPAKMAIKAGMASWDVVLKPLVILAIKQFIKEMKKSLTDQIAAVAPAPVAAPAAPAAQPPVSAPATTAAPATTVAPATTEAQPPAAAPATTEAQPPAVAPAAGQATGQATGQSTEQATTEPPDAPATVIERGVYPYPPDNKLETNNG
jgi:hypothetical protein